MLFYDPYLPNGVDKSLGVERTKDIREFFRRSMTLTIHCACTRETRDMVRWNLIRLMPKGAVLVNTGRGELLQLDAVERGLKKDVLAGVGLDVLREEPVDDDNVHPLIMAHREKEEWLQGRMVLTCHTVFYNPESFVDIRVKSAETLRDVLIDRGTSKCHYSKYDVEYRHNDIPYHASCNSSPLHAGKQTAASPPPKGL